MRFTVDLRECRDYAQCVTVSDEFEVGADGALAFRKRGRTTYESPDLPESKRPEVEDAVMLCPAQAIEITA